MNHKLNHKSITKTKKTMGETIMRHITTFSKIFVQNIAKMDAKNDPKNFLGCCPKSYVGAS